MSNDILNSTFRAIIEKFSNIALVISLVSLGLSILGLAILLVNNKIKRKDGELMEIIQAKIFSIILITGAASIAGAVLRFIF